MSGEGRRKLSSMITEVSGLKIDFVVGLFDLPVNCKKPFLQIMIGIYDSRSVLL